MKVKIGKMGSLDKGECADFFVKWSERGQRRYFMSKRLKIFENVQKQYRNVQKLYQNYTETFKNHTEIFKNCIETFEN